MKRDTQIGEDAVDAACDAEVVGVVFQISEIAVDGCESLGSRDAGYGLAVLVNRLEVAYLAER